MEIKDPGDLLQKDKEGKCSFEERVLVEMFHTKENVETSALSASELEKFARRVVVRSEVFSSPETKKMTLPLPIIMIAASITIAIVAVTWMLFFMESPVPVAYANDISPGTDTAILTLANGTKINLSEVRGGSLFNESGIEIIKIEDGTLVYKVVESKLNTLEYHTITTPKGGQYKIVLPDGTRVWLNAGSSLTYRTSLKSSLGERKVGLVGEAYFEVIKMKQKMPFIVKTDKQEVLVLGTHFNINSYKDEPDTKTTLLEGSVKVFSKGGDAILKPGQQSVTSSSTIQLSTADIDQAVAWKNGEFMFAKEDLAGIMKKIARWYNVEVVYADQQLENKIFNGTISKFKNVSQVLKMLEKTGEVKFKIEGRRITVMC
ncbi:FecR family protein [Pedobacter nyackensis]|uniref:FecR family protein n=1 Tax=Pedobacter nyackensis TaxID=475255 RepID=A0A1W2DM46_9SPHI|nr:FecR family protein [Pedobacter nyackensis]SMC98118.1 FecR family protein [Pedobacter nyackensis]